MLLAAGLGGCTAGAASPDTPRSSDDGAAGRITQGITGTVTRADGTPIAGAFIAATSLDRPSPPIPEIAILTNEAGRFTWPLRPGRYRVTALVDGAEVGSANTQVTRGKLSEVRIVAGG